MGKSQIVVASAFVMLVASACGGGGGGDASSTGAAASTSAQASTSAAAAGLVTSYQAAQPAVIQIAAEGEYRDVGMAEGQQGAWMGSGFIIDPSGLAVTNAHVAEGAATLKVYVGGDKDPINAKILGISECDDLAVIDLEGDGFAFMKWHQGEVPVTTKVWAAGFPLGDPQYTVTDGTVAKNNADGQREWASLDYVLESTAAIQHGNSGGPLLAEDGTVVGVNYAGGAADETAAAQFWAIPAALAEPIVDQLKTGTDTDSIGVNGTAFYDDQNALGGIWVSGVRSGSPASDAGIEPGDVITKMEGRDAVTDADVDTSGGLPRVTKAGYCNVLKTQGADRPIKLQVFRPSTGEVLEGEVNNADKPLVATSALSNTTTGDTTSPSSAPTGDVTFSTLTDDSGTISAEVPDVWDQTSTSGNEIVATADAEGFADGTATGIDFFVMDGAFASDDLDAAIKEIEADEGIAKILDTCQESESGTVTEGEGYTYLGDSYWSCQGSDVSYYLSIRSYPDQDKSVIILGQFTTDQDVEFVNRSLASLTVS